MLQLATLDQVVENLRKNFSEGTEYFQLLVEVFSSRFSSSKVDKRIEVVPFTNSHACQMAVARFLNGICLALRASGL